MIGEQHSTQSEGDTIWVNQSVATASRLAYVDSNGKAIVKVDNSSDVLYNYKRNSVCPTKVQMCDQPTVSFQVRISTTDSFPVGTMFLLDALHLPYGCSVWPGEANSSFFFVIVDPASTPLAFWTMGNLAKHSHHH